MKVQNRERYAATRRIQILDAAAQVFAERGFHLTTIKDIAREAGIADGTLYTYFENKTALLLGILERMRESLEVSAGVTALVGADFRSAMRAYLVHPLMALKADNFELFRVVVSEIMVNDDLRRLYSERILQPTLQGAETFFQYWVGQGVIRPVDLNLTLRAISGVILGLLVQHVMGDETLESRWEELPDFLTGLLLDGLLPSTRATESGAAAP